MVLISARPVQVSTIITEKKLVDKKLEVHHEGVDLETAMDFGRITLKWISGNYVVRMGNCCN
jgi:hypothetical protein